MWVKGYGSYVAIERAVDEGTLIPFRFYPIKRHECQDELIAKLADEA